jgi:flavin reductase (DIM6/NTAB) family NADH-FMN oxidoreductase RutF
MIPIEQLSGDPRALRGVFALFPSGVTVVCGLDVTAEPFGIAASSFTTVSLDPALVSVCVQKTSRRWPALRVRRRLGVSVLGEEQASVCRQISRSDGDRFEGIAWVASPDGAVFVEKATAHLDCSIYEEIEAGDHLIVLMRIHAVLVDTTIEPLVFHGSRFRRLRADAHLT